MDRKIIMEELSTHENAVEYGLSMGDFGMRPFDDDTGVEAEETTGSEGIVKPFDPTLIRIRTKPLTIDLLMRRIREGELELAPPFQRNASIWKPEAQSRLIESLLLKIPLPAFYFDATDDDVWVVVDGLQRLSTLKSFIIEDKLELVGLEFLHDIHRKKFSKLSRVFQRRIEESQVTVYLIEEGTPSEVKFNIFKRINTGGMPLSAQEIRHALNQGPVTEYLRRLAEANEFKRATDNSIRDKRMADRECVLRFMAFKLQDPLAYSAQDFDGFLNEAMGRINKGSDREREELEKLFLRSMDLAWEIFGNFSFRKRYKKDAPRFPINKALFEAWSVNLADLDDQAADILKERKNLLELKFLELMNDRQFDNSVSQGTGDYNRVKHRFGSIRKIIQEVLSCSHPSV